MATPSVCPKCGGTGWKIIEREEVSGAERCDCSFGVGARQREETASIPPLYANASFENFLLPTDNRIGRDELWRAKETVLKFVREFPAGRRPGLLLIGEPGTGKTHLAVAALRKLIAEKGFGGLFFDYQNLLDRIRSGYDAASNSSDREAYRFALEAEILLLDDLGAHRVTDWVLDTVTAIITHRCNHRKPLIATTNLPDREVVDSMLEGNRYKTSLAERIGERARSRLFEMCEVVRIFGVEDFRLRKSRSI